MAKLIKGINDLATCNPQLAKEWHPTKNGDLKPTDITCNSNKEVWWYLPYDTEDGRHFDFEWQAKVSNRNNGKGCPFLNGKAIWIGFNDLATCNPQLAKEWHPTKNGDLKPTDVTCNSNKEVWWYLPYDTEDGRHFDFEWQAKVSNRNIGDNCPFLNGKAIWIGFNDLATCNPQLAKEWHPTKNGDLKPIDVTCSSHKEVWWYLPYDTEDGRHFDFEWQATISDRNNNYGCPFLSGKAVWIGFNDLATVNPKLASEWHPTKNGDLTPFDVTYGSGKEIWWYMPYDTKDGKHFDFEWQATISDRNNNYGCPFLSGKAVWIGFNDLLTCNPQLASEWHPTKNGDLTPFDVTCNSPLKVWWYMPYDTEDGKHFDFEWQATVSNRNSGNNCPFLSGRAIWIGFNDLATVNPKLASEWHPTKNGDLTPFDVTCGSGKKVWWYLPYDDPKTGKHFDFEWQASIKSRNKGSGCPFLISSKTEILLYDLMEIHNISFIPEYKFLECKSIHSLPFDLYLNNENIIIELDGMQHFEPIDYFGGKDVLKVTKKHDNIKNRYCFDNNIPLLRIPYIYDPVVDKEKIETIVLEFIQTKKVPQEILNFYTKHKFSNYVNCVKELELKMELAA